MGALAHVIVAMGLFALWLLLARLAYVPQPPFPLELPAAAGNMLLAVRVLQLTKQRVRSPVRARAAASGSR